MRANVGVIGGLMGAAIAWRLLSEGPVVVWIRTAAKCDPFGKAGPRVASTPGELVAAADIVIIVTSTCHDVGAILQGCSAVLRPREVAARHDFRRLGHPILVPK